MTDGAAKKIQSIKSEEAKDDTYFLRVEVRKGGCAGLSYKMDFSNELRDGDQSFEYLGQKVVVDANSFLYLAGMTLDYSGGLNGKGFVFENPNAAKSCGCGTSFNISKEAAAQIQPGACTTSK